MIPSFHHSLYLGLQRRRASVTAVLAAFLIASPAYGQQDNYLGAGEIDLTRLLAPPPVAGSHVQKADLAAVLAVQHDRMPAEVDYAIADVDKSVFRFADVLGPHFAAASVPLTAALFARIARDADLVTTPGKAFFARPRPFVTSAEVKPTVATKEKGSYRSYPSGHATIGYLHAILLADMVPEHRGALFARGERYAQHRVVDGVHYPSDIEAGKINASLLAAALLRKPAFAADYAAARQELCRVLQLGVTPAQSRPLTLLSTTPLPQISGGDFDHFEVDLQRRKLYVPSEVYGSIEVFKLPDGQHLESRRGLATSPHKILLTHEGRELWIADAGGASMKVVDTANLSLKRSVALEPQPDSGIVDEKRGIFYLGNGGKGTEDHAWVSLISLHDHAVLGRIAVPAKQVKAMAINAATDRLFVNFRDRNEIGVIDLGSRKLVGIWPIPRPSRNSALAFDPATNRLFVGARNPGTLFVLDAANGKLVQTLDIVETSDEMIVDAEHHRLYVVGAGGLDVISAHGADNYQIDQHIDTLGGKTAQYVPSLNRLYVVHTKGPQAEQAGLQVFEVQ